VADRKRFHLRENISIKVKLIAYFFGVKFDKTPYSYELV